MGFLGQIVRKEENYIDGLRRVSKLSDEDWLVRFRKIVSDSSFEQLVRFVQNPYDESVDVIAVNRLILMLGDRDVSDFDIDASDIPAFRDYYAKDDGSLYNVVMKKMIPYLPFLIYIQDIFNPWSRMLFYAKLHRKKNLKELVEVGEYVSVDVQPEDVYCFLQKKEDQDEAIQLLRNVPCPFEFMAKVIRAYSQRDQDSFCSLLRDNCVDLSSFSGLCIADKLEGSFDWVVENDSSSISSSIMSFVSLVRNFMRQGKTMVSDEDQSEEDLADLEKVAKAVKDAGELNNENVVKYIFPQIPLFDAICFRSFKKTIRDIASFTKAEQDVFYEVVERSPAAKLWYLQYKEKYEEELEKDPKTREHNFSKYNTILKQRVSEHPEEYLGITNPDFIKNPEKFAILLEFLYTNRYLKKTDIPLFIYRVSGRGRENVSSLYSKIEWKPEDIRGKDLYFLLQTLMGKVSNKENVKKFFSITPDEKQQVLLSNDSPSQAMRQFLDSLADTTTGKEIKR